MAAPAGAARIETDARNRGRARRGVVLSRELVFSRSRAMLAAVLIFAVLAGAPARAEPPAALAELGVDQITLKQGPRLRGTVFERAADGQLSIAVSRAWLREAYPRFHETVLAEEEAERDAAIRELRDRLADWMTERADDKELSFFLGKQSDRVDKLLKGEPEPDDNAPGDSGFFLLKFPKARCERVFIQPESRKQIALVAWREMLTHVETRSVRSLDRELRKLGIDPAKEQVDLSDRLPLRKQSEAEWAARRAIVEYQFRKPLDFQGMGETLIRTGAGAKAPAAGELLASVLKGQVGSQLTDLLEGPKGDKAGGNAIERLQAAIQTAEREHVAGFRVTRVSTNVPARLVTVETCFVARLPDERWETVWRHAESVDASRPDKERLDRIARDPQVAEVLTLIKATGLAEGDSPINSALQFGAATMQAQESADSKFLEFRDRHIQRLEGPPLRVAETAPRKSD
jgi:hypothetical protein